MNSAEVLSLMERGVLKVGVRTDIPGMALDGEGLEIALAEALGARFFPDTEDSVQLVAVTAMTAGAKLSDGSIDVAIAMMPRNASTSTYAYSAAYYSDTCRFVVRENDWLSLQDAVVGYVQTSPTASVLSAYIAAHPEYGIKIRSFSAYPDMLLSLAAGEVDAVALTDIYIRKYEADYAFTSTDTTLGSIDYAIASPVDSSAFVRIANLMLADMKADGSLARLYSQFGLAQY